jgi:uncharacterized protein with PIN domain
VRRQSSATERRFVADAMLGRLARWLRLLGFDCTYDSTITDEGLVRLALADTRTILTRDRRLPKEWWIEGIYLVRAESVRNQLVEVIQRFGLASSIRILTRCSACNRTLNPVSRAEVSGRVPPRTFSLQEAFFECPGCRRVYWEGSHAARIREFAETLVSGFLLDQVTDR